ncbi:MAG: thioredoxin-dependent thiol peroxidase [Victivallaceae bacterium]|jgi:peroxiredoxin Q/BCP|nr:thioredoxin-dependent thiol peroxidase [Victivallaceae bacterium]NLK84073.1 thioredoxin-dependent thiol peroxidase [Lentisphaerota bacterium]MDD3116668.1 thioredoxin-dependent thiol peroxidase [Victivallaceae bacterium]MDD3703650.1 thioredoxin-dependent thiol peroxidase [Victivallaceae bacterium]MDD4317055.1 thioredoxin-dependent thiol peroxidase [Victivallaceae bacterium]
MKLTAGQPAPDFKLTDQHGNEITLQQLKGSKVLLYFYPKANTPGCTIQACSLRDHWNELKKKGVTILGVSPDAPAAQKKFSDRYELNFPLLADTERHAAEAYGVWDKKSLYGKLFFGIIRSSFLIDEDGILIGVWYKVKPAETAGNALDLL